MSLANYQTPSNSERAAPPTGANNLCVIPEVGVALFDDPQAPTSGWCSIDGHDAFRFSGVADLRNTVLWVTNLDYASYSTFAKNSSNVRRMDFFRNSLAQISSDLGFMSTGAYAQDAAKKLSAVSMRVVAMAARCYGIDNMTTVLRTNNFYEDLRGVLPRSPAVAPGMAHALESSYQSFSASSSPMGFVPDSLFLLLRRNRLHHAIEVMDTPIPDEGWEYRTGESLKFWLDEKRTCIVEATVELSATDPDIASLVAFGSTPGTVKKSVIRSFISQPELHWLVKHAKVQITGGHVCSPRPVPKEVRLPAALTADPLFALSYSAGLLAEMHWNAYACQPWSKNGGPNGGAGKSTNTWGVWFRAMDRAISFEMALEAQKAGFTVSSYGNGSMRIRVGRWQLQEAEKFAGDMGICHPSFETVLREHGIPH